MINHEHITYKITLLIIYAVLCSSCATRNLWTDADIGAKYLEVSSNNGEDVEAALKSSGKEYYCSFTSHPAGGLTKACYVKHYPSDKMETVEIKLFQTPKALLVDVGIAALVTVYVIGSVTLDWVLAGNSIGTLESMAEKVQSEIKD